MSPDSSQLDPRAIELNESTKRATAACGRLVALGADEEFIDAAWPGISRALIDAGTASSSVVSVGRAVAWHLREVAREAKGDALARHPAEEEAVFALALPRMSNHLVDMLALATELRARGREVLFGSTILATEIRSAGFPLDRMSDRDPLGLAGELASVALKTSFAIAKLAVRGDPAVVGVMLPSLMAMVRPFVRCRRALKRLILARRPRLLLVGNPNTLEGRIAAKIGGEQSIRVVALQHGSIPNGDRAWSRSKGVHVFCWGPSSREALVDSGVVPEFVHVTGAMRLDARVGTTLAPKRATIVVATSGAGHQVGIAEHLQFVESVYEAAARAPRCKWVVQLHQKDRSSFYRDAARRWPAAKVQLHAIRSNTGTDVVDDLREACALVTVISTVALDAMVMGIPVISVQLSRNKRHAHEFVRSGAVKVVTTVDQLAAVVDQVSKGQFPKEVTAAAGRQRQRYFANIGNAAKVAANLCEELASTCSRPGR